MHALLDATIATVLDKSTHKVIRPFSNRQRTKSEDTIQIYSVTA